jgi:hypothetical protein
MMIWYRESGDLNERHRGIDGGRNNTKHKMVEQNASNCISSARAAGKQCRILLVHWCRNRGARGGKGKHGFLQ